MRDIKTKKCGCIVFEVGPPVPCEAHAAKAERKARREKILEEKGLRRAVSEQAETLGHELTRFQEYPSQRGKWTAFCRKCGDMCIVYDTADLAPGDQVAGHLLEQTCRRSELVAVMNDARDQDQTGELSASA